MFIRGDEGRLRPVLPSHAEHRVARDVEHLEDLGCRRSPGRPVIEIEDPSRPRLARPFRDLASSSRSHAAIVSETSCVVIGGSSRQRFGFPETCARRSEGTRVDDADVICQGEH